VPNDLLTLREFSRGIVLAMDQSDLPPSALRILENLDARTPGKLALLYEDAILGSDRWNEVHAEHDDGYNAPGDGYADSATVPGPIPGDPPTGSEPNAYASETLNWEWFKKLVDPGVGIWRRNNPASGATFYKYLLLRTHTSGASTEPGDGADWQQYWRGPYPDNAGLPNWAMSTAYTVPANSSLLGFPSYPRRYGLLRQDDTRFVWTLNRFRSYSFSGAEYRDGLYVRDIENTLEPYCFFWHADRSNPSDPEYGTIDINQNPVEAHNKLLIQLVDGPGYNDIGNQVIFWQVPRHHFNRTFWVQTLANALDFSSFQNGQLSIPESGLPFWYDHYEIYPKRRNYPPGDPNEYLWDPNWIEGGPSWSDFMGANARTAANTSLGLTGLPEYDVNFNPAAYTHIPFAIPTTSWAHANMLRDVAGTPTGLLPTLISLSISLGVELQCFITFARRNVSLSGEHSDPYDYTQPIRITGQPIRVVASEVDPSTGKTINYWKVPFSFIFTPFVTRIADPRHFDNPSFAYYDLALTNSTRMENQTSPWCRVRFELAGTPIQFEVRGDQLYTQKQKINWIESPPASLSTYQESQMVAGRQQVRDSLLYASNLMRDLVGANTSTATVLTSSAIIAYGNEVPIIGLTPEGFFDTPRYVPLFHTLFVREDTPANAEYTDASAFRKNPLWTSSGTVSYYLVAEWDWGGWSSAQLIKSGQIDTVEDGVSMAVMIQVFNLLHSTRYVAEVRRWHVFRKYKPLSADEVESDTWLFAIDPRDGVHMTSDPFTAETTVGLYMDQGSRDGYEIIASGQNALELLGEAFWYIMAPGLLATFVDYGQDPAGQSAETLTGIPLDDLIELSKTTNLIKPSSMEMKSVAGNRLWFARGNEVDRAYFSEVGRYNLVNTQNYVEIPGAGRFIGAADFHQYLILFFRDATIPIDARGGIALSWQKVTEFKGAGAQSMDMVDKWEGGIIWAGSGAVWLWDGASPAPIRLSTPIEYAGFVDDMYAGDDIEMGYPKAWGKWDPERSEYMLYIPFMKGGTTSEYGEFLFDDLEGISPSGSGLFDMKPRLLVWSAATNSWRTESLRVFLNMMDAGPYSFFKRTAFQKIDCHYWRVAPPFFVVPPSTSEPYKYVASMARAIRPIVLDNKTLIPIGSARNGSSAANNTHNHWLCPYLVVRQGVRDFVRSSFWVDPDYNEEVTPLGMEWWPIFKHGIAQTGLIDMGNPGSEKRLRKLIASFGGDRVGRQFSSAGEVPKSGPWMVSVYGFRTGSLVPYPYRQVGSREAAEKILTVNFDPAYSSDVAVSASEHFHELYAGGWPCRYFIVRIEAGSLLSSYQASWGGNRVSSPPFRDLESISLSFMTRRQR